MQRQVVHITCFDEALSTPTRRVGVVNFGLYCACGEFVALSVSEPRQRPAEIEFKADQPILIRCPYCQLEVRRHVHEIRRIRLTEQNRRRFDRTVRHSEQR